MDSSTTSLPKGKYLPFYANT